MIGVSLPMEWLQNAGMPYGDPAVVFEQLKDAGVESAELRAVRPGDPPAAVLDAARTVWAQGMQITVHGTVKTAEGAADEVFAPLTDLLKNCRQESLTVTLHPINGDNAAMLTALARHIEKEKLPVTVALENNRRLPDKKTEGDSAALALQAVLAVDDPHIRLCWDMGHWEYYVGKNRPDEPLAVPDSAFLSRTVHTHIHGMDGLKTHFPLWGDNLPLDHLLTALGRDYAGVYNLELDPARWADRYEPLPALLRSVEELKKAIMRCGV